MLADLPSSAWDGPVVRLMDQQQHPHPALLLQTARYFDYIGTNLSAQPCERTDAIGLSALLFTADGLCVLQRRHPDLAIRPGMLGPSMSGTLEPRDVQGLTWLHELQPHREIREELGVSTAEIAPCTLLGLAREPERNGAPELLFSGRLHLTATELQQRPHPEGTLVFVKPHDIATQPNQAPAIALLHALSAQSPQRGGQVCAEQMA